MWRLVKINHYNSTNFNSWKRKYLRLNRLHSLLMVLPNTESDKCAFPENFLVSGQERSIWSAKRCFTELYLQTIQYRNTTQEKQMIHLQYDPSKTSVDAISKAIAKAGHDTDTYKADQTSTTNCRVVANTGNKRILQPGQATSPSSPLLSFFILVAIFGRA